MKTPYEQEIEKLEEEKESIRAIIQTYLESDKDIDEMDYNMVVNYAVEEIQDGSNLFLCNWKDYAFLRGKLEGMKKGRELTLQEVKKDISEVKKEWGLSEVKE